MGRGAAVIDVVYVIDVIAVVVGGVLVLVVLVLVLRLRLRFFAFVPFRRYSVDIVAAIGCRCC